MGNYGRGCRPDPDLAQPRAAPPTHLPALVKTDSRAPGDPQPCLSPTQTSKEGGNLYPAGRAGWPKGHPLPRVARQAPGSPVRGEPEVNCEHTLSTHVSWTLHKILTQNVADLIFKFNWGAAFLFANPGHLHSVSCLGTPPSLHDTSSLGLQGLLCPWFNIQPVLFSPPTPTFPSRRCSRIFADVTREGECRARRGEG